MNSTNDLPEGSDNAPLDAQLPDAEGAEVAPSASVGSVEAAGVDAAAVEAAASEETAAAIEASSIAGLAAVAAPSEAVAPAAAPSVPAAVPESSRPTFLFLGVVAGISLFLDIATKAWAEVTVSARGFEPIEIIDHHLSITLAYNRGGAWGIFRDAGEMVRKPFFVVVSVAAILFIVSLYGRLHRSQKSLTWGLPLVLGGALGNLSDRITRSQVIDFIDYRANWVMHLNGFVHKYVSSWTITDHWPTFNVADIAICVGVGLMAVDMFTARKNGQPVAEAPVSPVLPIETHPS